MIYGLKLKFYGFSIKLKNVFGYSNNLEVNGVYVQFRLENYFMTTLFHSNYLPYPLWNSPKDLINFEPKLL